MENLSINQGGAVLMVIENSIELVVGFRSLPLGTEVWSYS